MLPAAKAQLYLKHKFTIHHIADIVRLRAVSAHPGSERSSADHILAPVGAPAGVAQELDVKILDYVEFISLILYEKNFVHNCIKTAKIHTKLT